MLKFKLMRFGKRHEPHYRIVVSEARSKRQGKFVEQVGIYNPISKDLTLVDEKIKYWLANGAQPTDTVSSLFAKHNLIPAVKRTQTSKKKKNENK